MNLFIGRARLGSDPVLAYVGEDKKPVLNVRVKSLDFKRSKANPYQWEDVGLWYDLALWNYPKEAQQLFKKGNAVFIKGSIYQRTDLETDKEYKKIDAEEMLPLTPMIQELVFLPTKKARRSEPSEQEE
ncbi:MAG: single-stranded DNA-binding protein [Pseudomonadales bacterium]|nr:single-stranded DNA-binding protein [Pseudomonadales bacterium]